MYKVKTKTAEQSIEYSLPKIVGLNLTKPHFERGMALNEACTAETHSSSIAS